MKRTNNYFGNSVELFQKLNHGVTCDPVNLGYWNMSQGTEANVRVDVYNPKFIAKFYLRPKIYC